MVRFDRFAVTTRGHETDMRASLRTRATPAILSSNYVRLIKKQGQVVVPLLETKTFFVTTFA